MCGISCILVEEGAGPLPSPEQERRKLLLELEESLELIKHRGPDSRGQWISSDNRVGPLSLPNTIVSPRPVDLITSSTWPCSPINQRPQS